MEGGSARVTCPPPWNQQQEEQPQTPPRTALCCVHATPHCPSYRASRASLLPLSPLTKEQKPQVSKASHDALLSEQSGISVRPLRPRLWNRQNTHQLHPQPTTRTPGAVGTVPTQHTARKPRGSLACRWQLSSRPKDQARGHTGPRVGGVTASSITEGITGAVTKATPSRHALCGMRVCHKATGAAPKALFLASNGTAAPGPQERSASHNLASGHGQISVLAHPELTMLFLMRSQGDQHPWKKEPPITAPGHPPSHLPHSAFTTGSFGVCRR